MNSPELGDSLRQTLHDIDFFHALVLSETAELRARIKESAGSANPGQQAHLDALIEGVACALGELSARVRLIEQVLTAEGRGGPERGHLVAGNLSDTWVVSADGMEATPNLLALEYTSDGLPFRWTGPEASTTFELPISRVRERGLVIDVVAVVKPEYLRQLQLLVDGEPVHFEVGYDGTKNSVRTNLPARPERSVVRLGVKVPATHCPRDLGDSTDARRLGVAISRISVGEPVSLAGRHRVRSALRRLTSRE